MSRKYRDGPVVLGTIFDTRDRRVALIDFMPFGRPNSSAVRVVEGRGGRVLMHIDLRLRFDYGASVPWVTGFDNGFPAPRVAKHTLQVKDGFL